MPAVAEYAGEVEADKQQQPQVADGMMLFHMTAGVKVV